MASFSLQLNLCKPLYLYYAAVRHIRTSEATFNVIVRVSCSVTAALVAPLRGEITQFSSSQLSILFHASIIVSRRL